MTFDDSVDPIVFGKRFWPHVTFYKEQRQLIYSVRDNVETYCVAAHEVGKDFTTGFICLWYYLTHHTCRIVTTSVKDDHLRVLWGEIGRFIDTCKFELRAEKGGPLLVNHREIKKVVNKGGDLCPISYLVGMVAKDPQAMAGHHADYTMFVGDEASAIPDQIYQKAITWADRLFFIGNPYPGGGNFFEKAVKGGDKELVWDED